MARLSYGQRKALPKKAFAIPSAIEKGPEGGKYTRGAYPIPDEAHARNALQRVSLFGTPKEKAKVRAAVARKFPEIEQTKGKAARKGK